MNKDNLIEEITERIVILYANYSGRESDNRAKFRLEVRKLIEKFFRETWEEALKELESKIPSANNPANAIMNKYCEGENSFRKRVLEIIGEIKKPVS